jgi:hypothetical protein
MNDMSEKERLRRLRHKKKKVRLTIDDAGTVVERKVASTDAVPGWGEADVPKGHTKEDMLTRSLDIALGLLYHERAMLAVDLANLVVQVWKVQANYTYGEFIEAAQRDPRFQVSGGGLIALADEPDSWGVLLARVEQEQARMIARQRCDD